MTIKSLIDSIEMCRPTDDAGKDNDHHAPYEPFCPAFGVEQVVFRDLNIGCGLFGLEFCQEFVSCFVLTYPYLGNTRLHFVDALSKFNYHLRKFLSKLTMKLQLFL